MSDWVTTFKPYNKVEVELLRMGTVLKRVPFSVSFLGVTAFGLDSSTQVKLGDISLESEIYRSEKAVISPAVILTPDCDIFQHKTNRVVVAQLVSLENHIKNQSLNSNRASKLRDDFKKCKESNPGAFNHPGLFPMLEDKAIGFTDHVVLLDNICSLPIDFVGGQSTGLQVTPNSIVGVENIWFWIQTPELRARLATEFSRHMLRIGLLDSG